MCPGGKRQAANGRQLTQRLFGAADGSSPIISQGDTDHVDPLCRRLARSMPTVVCCRSHGCAEFPIIPPGMQGPRKGFTIRFAPLDPYSRGSVRLAPSDPGTAPLIDFGFLTDERDVAGMLAGLRLAREIGAAQAIAEWRKEEVLPGAAASTAARQHDFLRRSVGTYYHAVGTCKMGTDTAAVTDPQLRVHGIDRVIEKAGLTLVRTFRQPWPYPIEGDELGDVEYALTKADWEKQNQAGHDTPSPA